MREIAVRGAAIEIPRGQATAPTRFRIWKSGSNPGDYGDCNFTPRAAQRVMANQAMRGNALPIDVEHNSNLEAHPSYDFSNPPEGGGYAVLCLVGPPDAPELWVDPADWSDYARAQIESKSRRYISPDWDLDADTREPIRLKKVSLVQHPGTFGIPMLASAKKGNAQVSEYEAARVVYREEQAKESAIAAAKDRPGMTSKLAAVLQDLPLADVQKFIAALPAGEAVNGDSLSAEDRYTLARIDKRLGVTSAMVAAAEQSAADGTLGVLSVKRLMEMKRRRKEAEEEAQNLAAFAHAFQRSR